MVSGLVAAGVAAVLGLVAGVSFNRFVAQRNSIDASWGAIDVELQRRHDLIPNLVETVRGYTEHEKEVFRRVTSARSRAVAADRDAEVGPAEQAREENVLTDTLRTLFAVAEDYPELQASTSFVELQQQLVETEDRIAAARRLYNIEVTQYNRRTEAVPSNLIAGVFDFERRELFELDDHGVAVTPATAF